MPTTVTEDINNWITLVVSSVSADVAVRFINSSVTLDTALVTAHVCNDAYIIIGPTSNINATSGNGVMLAGVNQSGTPPSVSLTEIYGVGVIDIKDWWLATRTLGQRIVVVGKRQT